jgi:protein SCO1
MARRGSLDKAGRLLLLLAVCLSCHEPAWGDAKRKPMPDVAVLDQDGRKLHFYTDLIKGKTVVVSFIYTSCTAFCPMTGRSLQKLQAALGERSGKEIHLISVTTDPATDRPERLKAWGERFGAGPGWTLVTGDSRDMDTLLEFLTGDPAGRGMHSPAVLIGSYDQGAWIRESGIAEPERYLEILAELGGGPASGPETPAPSPR